MKQKWKRYLRWMKYWGGRQLLLLLQCHITQSCAMIVSLTITTMSSTCTSMSSLATPPPTLSILPNFHPSMGNKSVRDARSLHLCVRPSSLLKSPVITRAKKVCFYTLLPLYILPLRIMNCSLTLGSSKTTKCIWLVKNSDSKDCTRSMEVPI